jgi:hypothetical protein
VEAQDIKIQKKRQEILELENALKGLGDITNVDRVFSSLEELGVNTEGIERTEDGLQQIKQSLLDVNSATVDKIKESL